MKNVNTRTRSLIKTLSWRIVATIGTLLSAFIIVGSWQAAGITSIGAMLVKSFVYYFHERIWSTIPFGLHSNNETLKRSFLKAIVWRLVGSLTTFLVSWFILRAITIAAPIAAIEIAINLVFYIIHERIWNLVSWGKELENSSK